MTLKMIEARNLKHNAAINDIKVTIKTLQGEPVICIRDYEIKTYADALACIGYINTAERPGDYPVDDSE
jgi:hypothetical protein